MTAGAQYVTATAGGSPSGIAEIDCSVDGGPTQRYSEGGAQQPSVQVPVSGLGVHTIQCSAENTAVAQDGSHGWSTSPATTTLKIGEPTASAITFGKVINALRCKRVRERVRVPAHWVTVRRHHKLVRVRRRAHTKVVEGGPLPSANGAATGDGVGHGPPARQEGAGQAHEARAGGAHSPARWLDDAAGPLRPRNDGQRLAGNHGRHRARWAERARADGPRQRSRPVLASGRRDHGGERRLERRSFPRVRRGWWKPCTTAARRPRPRNRRRST